MPFTVTPLRLLLLALVLTLAAVTAGALYITSSPQTTAKAAVPSPAIDMQVVVDGRPQPQRVEILSRSDAREVVEEQWPDAQIQLIDAQDYLVAKVDTPQEVTVVVGKNESVVSTYKASPSAIVAISGYSVHTQDKVVALRTKAGKLTKVQVVKVRANSFLKTQKIPAPTKTIKTSSLNQGEREVVSQGKPGSRKTLLTKVTHNGKVKKTTSLVLSTKKPQPRVIKIGTATPKPATSSSAWPKVPGGAEDQNWEALAFCESSGNPKAVNPAGYYGLYQFNVGTWGTVGGTGLPSQASAAEQTYRAKLLFASRGAQPWPHCGKLL